MRDMDHYRRLDAEYRRNMNKPRPEPEPVRVTPAKGREALRLRMIEIMKDKEQV